jgi:hypothetical protein
MAARLSPARLARPTIFMTSSVIASAGIRLGKTNGRLNGGNADRAPASSRRDRPVHSTSVAATLSADAQASCAIVLSLSSMSLVLAKTPRHGRTGVWLKRTNSWRRTGVVAKSAI